jgi:hypothetical protein
MVATGWKLPIAFTGAEFLWACACGAAEFAAEVTGDDKPSFLGTEAGVEAESALRWST